MSAQSGQIVRLVFTNCHQWSERGTSAVIRTATTVPPRTKPRHHRLKIRKHDRRSRIEVTGCSPSGRWGPWATVLDGVAVRLGPFSRSPPLLVAGVMPLLAADKPIQIGVLALGPRHMPEWRCGEADYRPGADHPTRRNHAALRAGPARSAAKLDYVEDKPENAGQAGPPLCAQVCAPARPQQLREAAREFVAKPVDVIVAVATAAVSVAKEETRERPIPILTTGVSDHVQYGFAQSLARPGGTITGVSHQVVQGSAKRVELFKEMMPGPQAPDHHPRTGLRAVRKEHGGDPRRRRAPRHRTTGLDGQEPGRASGLAWQRCSPTPLTV